MTSAPLTRSVTFIMSLAMGVIIADLYYLQPLLHTVRADFHISTAQASLLVTIMQLGFAAGLAFIVPLGDVLARRRLIVALFSIAVVAMLGVSLVHSYAMLAVVSVVVGMTAVGSHVILPFAADHVRAEERGRVVATLMSGLLSGALLSRVAAGALSEWIGWRGVYASAAFMVLVMTVVLWRTLPGEAPRPHQPYRRVVAGAITMLRDSSLLRRRSWLGATAFGSFNAVWATLAFHLAAPPFRYSAGIIGLFGFVGLAGISMANVAGRRADNQQSHQTTLVTAALLVLAFVLLWIGRHNIAVIALGIIVLDMGVQGMQFTNQALIYTIDPTKRSRINSAYMVCFFAGASLGSLGAGLAYAQWGWAGTCGCGAVLSIGAVLGAWQRAGAPGQSHQAEVKPSEQA
jgi:predicted MFS family arabinose efflux permease